ncbi:MAG: IS66 family transposase [Bacteroidota bacterium]|nr:IS66 family transposase [Bacteroidota bacterium]MDQ3110271.1 IS66 family transposase [Bacteroidota bacterium]
MNYETILAEKDARIALLERNNIQLQQELAHLKRLIYGSKRERFLSAIDQHQLSLFGSDPAELQTENIHAEQHIEYDRKVPKKHPGRNELPDHLPVLEVIIEPAEDITDLIRIGEEITETLEYTPASLVKKRVIRPKYARKNNEGIAIAELSLRPFPKSIAEVTLVAYILVCKFIDHMPFYRQIQRFKRDFNWDVSDSTLNEWFVSACILLHPLYELLQRKILEGGYLQVDESPIKVLDHDHDKGIHQGYQWVYYNPELKWVFFNYRKGRGQHGPKEILEKYEGILQTDGWQVYDKFKDMPGITLVGCLAHARRYFDKSLKTNKTKSQEVLTIIQRIYAQERLCKEMSPDDRKIFRDQHVRPIFTELRQWLDEELQNKVEPKSDYGQAITYMNKQWPKLIGVLENGRVELDNNQIENKIRPLALGRKNYLFAGSHDAAKRIAMMYSFFGSCKAHDINPYEWLKNTLEKISDTKLSDLGSLLPGAGV